MSFGWVWDLGIGARCFVLGRGYGKSGIVKVGKGSGLCKKWECIGLVVWVWLCGCQDC